MKNETNSNYFTNKPGQTGQRTNKLRHELILGCSGGKGCLYHHAQYNDIVGMNIFNKKEVYSYDRCRNPVYFDSSLLIIYMSAIETLICNSWLVVLGFNANLTAKVIS